MHSKASVPRFNNYAIAQSDATVASLTTAMQLAVYTGLYARPTNSSESIRSTIVCPTGNCTFPVESGASFDTLTMCHTCRDVTNKLTMSNATSSKRDAQEAGDYVLTGYPGNLSLASSKGPGFSGKMFNFGTSRGVYASNPTNLWPAEGWNSTTLLSIQGIALVKPTPQDNKSDLVPMAFDCALRPCVISFNASVQNGKYAETEIARQYLHAIPFDKSFQLVTSSAVVNRSRQSCVASDEKTVTNSAHVLLPASASSKSTGLDDDGSSLPGKWYMPECVYSLTTSPTSALADFVSRIFDAASIQLVLGVDQVDGAVWLQALWSTGTMTMESIDRFMDGVALAIGAEMRSNKPPPQQHVDDGVPFGAGSVTGDALYNEVCIRVKWRYLSFLAVLLAIEVLFFAAVVFISQRSPWWCENWKTSALPLLAQAIRGEDVANGPARWSTGSNIVLEGFAPDQMAAKKVEVRLVEQHGEWRFAAR